tara:strand:- start:1464 stop:1994 length:531 start_codon:yes stop_codon:yes gene_type:complete
MKTEKRQYRKVGVAGGFVNQMMGNNATEPKVGEGATELMYSDRNPYEVLSVSEDGSECQIRRMSAKITNEGGIYGQQTWEFTSNEGEGETLKWHPKKGWCRYSETIEIQKSLANKLRNEYGWDWDNWVFPDGVTLNDLFSLNNKVKLVKGITKVYKNYSPISIIFGRMEKYYDPSF